MKKSVAGEVRIPVEEYERLRDIERKLPCVEIVWHDGWGNTKITYVTENEALDHVKKILQDLKDQIKEKDIVIKGLNAKIAILEKKKSIFRWFK